MIIIIIVICLINGVLIVRNKGKPRLDSLNLLSTDDEEHAAQYSIFR